jgi:hypothetical protein
VRARFIPWRQPDPIPVGSGSAPVTDRETLALAQQLLEERDALVAELRNARRERDEAQAEVERLTLGLADLEGGRWTR